MASITQQSLQYSQYHSVRDLIVAKFNAEGPTDRRFSTTKVEHIDTAIAQFTKRSKEKNVADNPAWHCYRAEFAVWSCNWPEQKDGFPGIEPTRMVRETCQYAYQDCPVTSEATLIEEKEVCNTISECASEPEKGGCPAPSESASEPEEETSTSELGSEAQPSGSPANSSGCKEEGEVLESAKPEESLKLQIGGVPRSKIAMGGLVGWIVFFLLAAWAATHPGFSAFMKSVWQ